MTISGTIEQAPNNAYYFTDVQSNDVVFRAFGSASYVFGSGSNVSSSMKVNSNIIAFNANTIGVGTSNPQGQFHIFNSNTSPVFLLDGNGVNNRGVLRILPTNAGNVIQSGVALSNDSKSDIVFSSMMGTTEWMRIRSATGSVGIGTSVPAYTLDVVGNGRFSTGLATNTLSLSNITANSNSNISIGCDANTSSLNVGCGSNTHIINIGATTVAGTIINIGGAGASVNLLGTVSNVTMVNATTSNKLVTLNSGGAVGSGTGAGIQVQEGSNITGYIKTSTDRNSFVFRSPTSTADLVMNLASGGMNINNNCIVVSSTSNVGINSASPAYKLDVVGTARATNLLIATGNNDNGNRLISALDGTMTTSNTRSFVLGKTATTNNQAEWTYTHTTDGSSSNYGSLGLNGSVALNWNGTGNVGIGTTTPQFPLHLSTVGTTQLLVQNATTGTGNTVAIDFKPLATESNPAVRISAIDDGSYGGHMTFSTKSSGSDTNVPIERLRVTDAGNVGIGTQFPAQKLDICGGLALRQGNTPGNPAGNQMIFAYSNSDNYKHAIKTRHAATDGTGNAFDFFVWQSAQAVTDIGNKPIMSVTSQGVGVGTSNPQYTLDVSGTLNATSFTVNGAAVNAASYWKQGTNTNWSPSNVVIGASSNTTYALDVGGQIRVSGASNLNGTVQGAYLNWNNSTGDGRTQIVNSRGGGIGGFLFDLYTTAGFSNTAMMIDGNANVGINTTSPLEKLHVANGNILLGSSNTDAFVKSPGQLHLWANQTGASNAYANMIYSVGSNGSIGNHVFYTQGDPVVGNGQERMRIASNGYVGIGNTTPQYQLDVTGQAHASSFPTSSDARFKTNVVAIPNALEKLCSLQGVTFDWNEKYPGYNAFKHPETNEPVRQIGLIAQDVKASCPELVTHWSAHLQDGTVIQDAHAVDYGRMAALYVEAFKEMKAEIDVLKAQVSSLTDK